MLRTFLSGRDEWQVAAGRHGRRQLPLGLLSGFLQALQRHRVFREIDALIAFELLDQPVDDPLVEIITAQVCVTVGSLDFENTIAELEHRNVVSTTTEIVYRNDLVFLFVET